MSRTPRRLRRGRRTGIPFVIRFTDRKTLSADEAGALLDDYIGHIYAIIAAVEDWYRERADELSVVDVIWGKARLAQAEAAVQRVRDVCEDYFHDRSDLDAVESLEAIRRALEGDRGGDE